MASLITTDYRAYPAIGQSSLKRCHKDPLLYYQQDIARTVPPDSPTKEMVLGQDLEDVLLYGKLASITVIPPEVLSASGSRAGAAWKAFAAENDGARLMKLPEFEQRKGECQMMARSVAEHPDANTLVFRAPQKKVGIAWNYAGLELKSEIDLLHPVCLGDIKTTTNGVAPERFASTCVKYGYDVQMAAYQIAVEQLTGDLLPVVLVAIDTEPSYSVETYQLSEAFLSLGRRKLNYLCEFYRACAESGEWRSATWGRVVELDPPRYAETNLEAWIT